MAASERLYTAEPMQSRFTTVGVGLAACEVFVGESCHNCRNFMSCVGVWIDSLGQDTLKEREVWFQHWFESVFWHVSVLSE